MPASDKILDMGLDVIKDVMKGRNFVAYILIGFIFLNIYWFIAIFLFSQNFYKANSPFIIAIFTSGLSFIWIIMNSLIFFFGDLHKKIQQAISELPNRTVHSELFSKDELNDLFFTGAIWSIIYLTGCIFTFYFPFILAGIHLPKFLHFFMFLVISCSLLCLKELTATLAIGREFRKKLKNVG